jgi:renalase
MQKIAIIGAGLTGLTLAHELQKICNITVFEKARGVGGRMATRYIDGYEFDHGAQYFTARTGLFQQLIQMIIEKNVITRWDARFAEIDHNQVVREVVWNAANPHYVAMPRMNALCKFLARNLDLRFKTKVKTIKPGYTWQLLDEHDVDLGSYDWVIVTAPAEQTTQLMPGSFKFRDDINAINMHSCYSLMLGVDADPGFTFDAALVTNADISWITVNSTKPGRPTLPTILVHSSNEWADKHLEQDLNTVTDHLCTELKRVTGFDSRQAKLLLVHLWRYANIDKQVHADGFIDAEQKLVACGDWCIKASVESAFLVGSRVAQQMLKIISENESCR